MASNRSTLSFNRTLFPYGYTCEYRREVVHPKFSLSRLVDCSLRKLLTREIFTKKSVLDIKGRDPDTLMDQNVTEVFRPKGEELFFLSGKVMLFRRKEEEIWEPFDVRVHTAFDRFVGNHHIVHGVSTIRSGALPSFVDVIDLGRTFPISPEYFRLGLEFFSSSFISASLGFAPTVKETLLLESTSERTLIGISAEGLKNKESFPLSKGQYAETIAGILQEVFEFDVMEDYRGRSQIEG